METITSGTTTERILRALLLALLVDLFAVAYLWDGYVGYARENGEELARLLGVEPDAVPAGLSELTRERGTALADQTKPGTEFAAVTSELGEPTVVHGDDAYYLGPAGWLHIAKSRDRVTSASWTYGKRTESDQQWQRWIGYVLALAGLVATANLARVLRTRATLTDAGLSLGGRRRVSWDDITGINTDPSSKDFRAELTISTGGKPSVLTLNAYVYKHLPAIVAAIRKRKGFGPTAPTGD